MLKLLTILFFLYTLSILISQHSLLKQQTTKALNQIKKTIINKNTTKLESDDYIHSDTLSLLFILILAWITYVIEVLYICFSIKYDPYQYIIIGYLIFWILMFAKGKLQRSKQLKLEKLNVKSAIEYLNNQITKVNKTTIWQVMQSIIDLSFYIYMIYIFFIR